MTIDRDALIEQARLAAAKAYAPYSGFHVGSALLFEDGSVVTGANVENASYGLTLCAETVAVGKALSGDWRGALKAVVVIGGKAGEVGTGDPITPCGRCRQVLSELAARGGHDPVVWGVGGEEVLELRLSELLPKAFGPGNFG